jgi:hypothetical protein
MTDIELEQCIKNAIRISLIPGFITVDGNFLPGQLTIVFHPKDVDNYLAFSECIRNEHNDFKKSIFIKEISLDKIDFTFTVEKNPAVILHVKNVNSNSEKISYFTKRQPIEKPILMVAQIIENQEAFFKLLEADSNHEAAQPIKIDFWKVSQIKA